jgi:hypothetical protein
MPPPLTAAATTAFIGAGVGIGIGIGIGIKISKNISDIDPDTEIYDKYLRLCNLRAIHESQEIQACN